MRRRTTLVVTLSLLVLLGGVAPAVGVNTGLSLTRSGDATGYHAGDGPADQEQNGGYEVSLNNVTIKTWLLRNSTVRNATVERVVVRNATSTDGVRENVTLRNVTVGTFVLERARLTNVTARKLVVRNKSVLDVPGGDLVDPNVDNRTIDRHWTKNATVAGVVIDRIAVDAAILCENATLGQEAEQRSRFDPRATDDDPDISVQNGTVEEALIIDGEASNWSVESMDQPEAADASLPEGCNPD